MFPASQPWRSRSGQNCSRASTLNPDDLIRIARHLASGGVGGRRGRPRQTELRRGLSAAYYALFHALARCCADTLVGSTLPRRRQQAWERAYRSLQHTFAKDQCNNQREMRQFPVEIQDFGRWFVVIQRYRHQADYAPEVTFTRSQVLDLVNEAERVIKGLRAATTIDQRAFAVHVLFRARGIDLAHPDFRRLRRSPAPRQSTARRRRSLPAGTGRRAGHRLRPAAN